MLFFDLIPTWLGVREFILSCIVFIPLERLLPLRKEQRVLRSGWRNDLVYVFLNGFIVRASLTLLILSVAVFFHRFGPSNLQSAVSVQPYWLQTIEVIVVADLGFYAAHRLFHEIPALWRFHVIHHSIEELDWLAAARVHPFDQILTKGGSLLPLVVLGFSDLPIVIFSTIYFWHSLLLHANVNISFGPLRWVIASPMFHRWHHANDPAAYNTNYAGQLSVLDKIFGTMYLPDGRTPKCYGVDDRVPPSYLEQLLLPLRQRERRNSAQTSLIESRR